MYKHKGNIMTYRNLESTIRSLNERKPDSNVVLDPKLDHLLRVGLASKEELVRMRRALSDTKAAGTSPVLRDLLMKVLFRVVKIVNDDPMIFSRVLQKVTKDRVNEQRSPEDEELEETEMFKNQLRNINDASTELLSMVKDGEDLDAWILSKITLASDYVDTVRDYMKYYETKD